MVCEKELNENGPVEGYVHNLNWIVEALHVDALTDSISLSGSLVFKTGARRSPVQ